MEPLEPLEPLDPLDRLVRPRGSEPLSERVRVALTARWPWVVAVVSIGVVAATVFVLNGEGTTPAVTLPRAGAQPAGSTIAAPSALVGADASATSTVGAASVNAGPAGEGPATTASSVVIVHVAGAVNAPGLVTLSAGARVADAVARAGGLRPDADGDRVNLAAPVVDGIRVYIPVIGAPDPPAAVAIPGPVGAAGALPGHPASPAAPVDLNAATEAELDTLPGVGPSTAAAIVAYRTEHRRFRNIDELQEVRGIGPAKFEAIAPLVTVGS